MQKCLVLITNFYPYLKGEEYIESEIPILAKRFDKVIILSLMVSEGDEHTRSVPDNVIVIPSKVSHQKSNRLKMLWNSLTEKPSERENASAAQKLYSKYFEARTVMILRNLEQELGSIDFSLYESVTLYSYWTYITAKIAVELKNGFFSSYNPVTLSRSHRYDLYENETKLQFLPQRNYLFNHLDYIFPVSDHGTAYLKSTNPEFEEKFQTKYLGTQPLDFRCEVKEGTFHLVSVSALRPVKRVGLILEAVEKLHAKDIDIKWTHFGDGDELSNLTQKSQALVQEGIVEFKGFVKNKDVLEWYRENNPDVFINVSKSEGVPVSIMEAASVGIPVIATDVGGTKESVINGYNGMILEADLAAQDLADALEVFIGMSHSERTEFSDNACQLWQERFNAQQNYTAFADFLFNLS